MTGRKITLLHIASDEKFIDGAHYVFEQAFPGRNNFIIPKSSFNRKFVYVKNLENTEVLPFNRGLIEKLVRKTREYDSIFLHGINELNSTIFIASEEKRKSVGILWGAELYNDENFPGKVLLGDLTSKIKLPKPSKSKNDIVKSVLRKLLFQDINLKKDVVRQAASGLNYFGVPYREEFDYFADRRIIGQKCKFVPFTYYPLEFILRGNEKMKTNGNNILVGNSANYTNNHLEVFRILGKLGIEDRKIIVPLSYGDLQYGEYIYSEGLRLLRGNFMPLRTFIPLEEYTRKLQSCGIEIMNHYRQQAVGNILMMIWIGSRVYLSPSSTLYNYLKRIGIKVFSIEQDLVSDNPEALINLSVEDANYNRIILKEEFSERVVVSRLRNAVFENFM